MHRFLSPFCLFIALTSLICGFALLAKGGPEPDLALHRARLSGDQEYQQRMEEQLTRRQRLRRGLIGGLFASSVLFTTVAFRTMNRRQQ